MAADFGTVEDVSKQTVRDGIPTRKLLLTLLAISLGTVIECESVSQAAEVCLQNSPAALGLQAHLFTLCSGIGQP